MQNQLARFQMGAISCARQVNLFFRPVNGDQLPLTQALTDQAGGGAVATADFKQVIAWLCTASNSTAAAMRWGISVAIVQSWNCLIFRLQVNQEK